MSFKILHLVQEVRFGSVTRKSVAMKLASHARDDGTKVFPSVPTVAAHTELSTRTVKRCLKELVGADFLRVVKAGGGGRHSPTEYAFNLPILEGLADGDFEFFTEKNPGIKEAGKARLAVRPAANSVASIAGAKGDTVSPLEKEPAPIKGDRVSPLDNRTDGPTNGRKGDTVSTKGDTVSTKGDTVSPKSVNNRSIKEEGERQRLVGGDNQAANAAPSPPSIFQIFEEFKTVAAQAGFVVPHDDQFPKFAAPLETTISAIGLDDWRAFLRLAAEDDLCTGRIAPGPGWQAPWRLSLKQASDAAWVSQKLSEYRASQIAAPASAHVVLTADSPEWFAVKNFYEAAGETGRLRVMEKTETWVVQPEELVEALKMDAEKKEEKQHATA